MPRKTVPQSDYERMMEAIGKEFHWIRENMVTKEEGLTKEDAKNFATKEDVQEVKQGVKELGDRVGRVERVAKDTFDLLDVVDRRTRHLPEQSERLDRLEQRVFKLERRQRA